MCAFDFALGIPLAKQEIHNALSKSKTRLQAGQKTKSKTLANYSGEEVDQEFFAVMKQVNGPQLRLQPINCPSGSKVLTPGKVEPFV